MLALSTADPAQLRSLCRAVGAPEWRAVQLRDALSQPWVSRVDDLRQLPAGLREALRDRLAVSTVEVAGLEEADGGRTLKLLCRLEAGATVEAVAMETPAAGRSSRRSTVCVSTQVGCAVGCPFCATGRLGLRRSCTAAEVVDQVRAAGSVLAARGMGPVTHVVYMGMGEPLAAYRATVDSMRALVGGAGLSPRRITLSTSGVAPAIERLAGEGLPVTLAVSLHAARDPLRDRLVPLNRTHPIERVLAAATAYARRTGRRLTLEWCLIAGVNDTARDAGELRELAAASAAHVNVIPMNPIAGSPWGPPAPAAVRAFMAGLRGVRATLRDTRGAQRDAACGQLRASLEDRRTLLPSGVLAPQRPAGGAPPR